MRFQGCHLLRAVTVKQNDWFNRILLVVNEIEPSNPHKNVQNWQIARVLFFTTTPDPIRHWPPGTNCLVLTRMFCLILSIHRTWPLPISIYSDRCKIPWTRKPSRMRRPLKNTWIGFSPISPRRSTNAAQWSWWKDGKRSPIKMVKI